MTKKVYVVFQEWEDKCGNRNSQILDVTFSKEKATKCLKSERDEILANYPLSYHEIESNDDYELEDEPTRFWLFDMYGGWDEINIIERDIELED